MDQRIIYKNQDDNTCIIIPSPKWTGTIEELAKKDVPIGISYKIVDITNIPKDRTFRNAWSIENETLKINMIKAREIAHNKRREARIKKFAPLDIEATIPSKAAQAESKRQAIRVADTKLQIEMDSAMTPEELKALLPKE